MFSYIADIDYEVQISSEPNMQIISMSFILRNKEDIDTKEVEQVNQADDMYSLLNKLKFIVNKGFNI